MNPRTHFTFTDDCKVVLIHDGMPLCAPLSCGLEAVALAKEYGFTPEHLPIWLASQGKWLNADHG
jgi:hypothetical protein